MKAPMTKHGLIFSILAQPVASMGRVDVVLSDDGKLKGIDFCNSWFSSVNFGAMLTPWQRTWARSVAREEISQDKTHILEANWLHLNKVTGQCQVFSDLGLPDYSDTRVIQECGDFAVLGGNGINGFHFYRLDDESLVLLNKEPIPYFIWSSWMEGEHIMLAGMTQRTLMPRSTPDEEKNFARGRPILLRCILSTGQWEEIPFMDPQRQGVDLLRDWPDDFVSGSFIHKVVTKAETWIGSERTAGDDRIILAGMGEQRIPFDDPQCTDNEQPANGDYYSLALVSYRDERILRVIPGCSFVRALYTPEKTLFVVQMDDGSESRWANRGDLSQLYVIDPLGAGVELLKMRFDGLPTDLPFVSRFEASYFNECGFFGVIKSLKEKYYFVQSDNGIDWKGMGDSELVEVKKNTDFL